MERICILVTIVAYLCLMLSVGVYTGKKRNGDSAGDFYLAGRKVGPLVTAMSAEASDMSSWLLMGLPGVAYLVGIADAAWTAIGLAIGTYFNWLLVSKKLHRYSVKTNAITVPNFFSNRYHDEKNVLACIAAIVIIVFFVPYTASGFKAIGTLLNSLFGLEYHIAMLIAVAVIVTYTVLGGFMAVATNDLIQSIVMSIALVLITVFGIGYAGGLGNVLANASAMQGYLSLTAMHNVVDHTISAYGPITIVSTMAWGLGYFGMPHILLRFMAIRDEKELNLSRRIGTGWVIIAMSVAIFIGVIGNAASANGGIPFLGSSSESETVIIQLANVLGSYGVFFAFLAGITMAGILACTMSTADSQLLAASSSVSQNLLQDFLRIKMDDKTSMLVARLTVAVVAVIGAVLAWNPNSSVFQIVSFAWAGFGAAFGPVMLCALFWRRSNKAGALAGMVAGGVMVFVWKFLVRPLGGVWNIYELLPAFLVALAAIVIVSLLTKAPSEEVLKEFDEVSSMK